MWGKHPAGAVARECGGAGLVGDRAYIFEIPGLGGGPKFVPNLTPPQPGKRCEIRFEQLDGVDDFGGQEGGDDDLFARDDVGERVVVGFSGEAGDFKLGIADADGGDGLAQGG